MNWENTFFLNMEHRVQGSELCWGYNNMSSFLGSDFSIFYEIYCVWLHKEDYDENK